MARAARARRRAAGGPPSLGVGRGDTVALMLANRPEFHLGRPRRSSPLGATPFSIYQTLTPEQIAYVIGDAGARVSIAEQRPLPTSLERARRAARRRARDRDRRRGAPSGVIALGDVEGSNRTSTPSAAWRAIEPGGRPHADLHLRHHAGRRRASSSRTATCIMARVAALERADRTSRTGDGSSRGCPSAHIAERAAHHYLPIVLRPQRSRLLRTRARCWSYSAAVRPALVLRRAADLGEAEGRRSRRCSPG